MPGPIVALIVILSVVLFIGLIIIISNIKIVKQTEKVIVERLGAYRTTWGVGLHMLVPFFDRIAVRVSMKEQVRDFEPQSVITKDNVTMQIDTVVFYVVTLTIFYLLSYPGARPTPLAPTPSSQERKRKKYTQLVVVQWMYWRGLCKR